MSKRVLSVLAMGLALVLGSANLSAAAVTIKVGHVQPTNDGMHLQWLFFKEQIEKRSNGDIKVEIYPNGELGFERELSEAVQMGELPMSTVTTSPLASFVPDLLILDVPFSWNNRKEVWDAMDGELGAFLNKKMADKGFVVLGWIENGFRNVTNNKRPIVKPEDLKGVKLRTMENPIHLAAWRALGANPTPMSYGEVFTALQQGTIDGQENPYAQIYHMKFYEVQKYLTDTQHMYSMYVNFMNKEYFDNLTKEQQKLILEVGHEQALYQRDLAERLSNEAGEKIRASGKTEFTNLTDEQRMAFRVASPPALELVKERASPEVVEL
ncbi:MAG: TRAP transporter substrate-binding protein, partial [Deltaproteobacteria bacterium]|nr:TRAP transporter substrate-binding protein [Deltaproteobacteria bacterium]